MMVRGERCVLRPWRTRDAASVVRYANNANVSRYLRDRFPYPYTMEHARAFLASAFAEEGEPTKLAIEVDGEAVGGIGVIAGADIERFSAEIGYWLGEPFWCRGIVSEALILMTEYAFDRLNLLRALRARLRGERRVGAGAGKGGLRPRGSPEVGRGEARAGLRPAAVRAHQPPLARAVDL